MKHIYECEKPWKRQQEIIEGKKQMRQVLDKNICKKCADLKNCDASTHNLDGCMISRMTKEEKLMFAHIVIPILEQYKK